MVGGAAHVAQVPLFVFLGKVRGSKWVHINENG